MCEGGYLRSDLRRLLGINCADVLIMFQRVLPVLLFGTDVLLQETQHLTGLVVAEVYGVIGVIILMYAL